MWRCKSLHEPMVSIRACGWAIFNIQLEDGSVVCLGVEFMIIIVKLQNLLLNSSQIMTLFQWIGKAFNPVVPIDKP